MENFVSHRAIMCCSMEWFSLLLGLLYVGSQTRAQENHLTCGKRTVTTEYLIHDGMDTKAGFWPWHVAIFHEQTGKMHYKCGGSIIDENTILTASHCVYIQSGVISISRVSVDVGRIHLNESSEYTQTHRVREIIVHPGFSKNSIVSDIALIKLSSNITMNKYVQPVCLWTMDSNQELIVGRNGTIVGFGVNEQDIVSEQLKQALIGVVDPFSCIASDRWVFGTHLTSDMFCGKGQKGVSACNGDSGGGMFFEIGGKWFVRGLVSFSPARLSTALCDPLKNTAYTDVAKYRVAIERIHIHPQYNRTNHAHDLALALLSTSADITLPNVRPICLPTIDSARSYDTSNLVQAVIGFSSTFNFGNSSVDDRYITSAECQSRWQGLEVNFSVDRSKHCVISKRALNNECVYTDFGGSLHSLQWLESKQRRFLRGFAVILPRACSIYYPVVYTNTDVYLDWILEAMKESPNLPFDLKTIVHTNEN